MSAAGFTTAIAPEVVEASVPATTARVLSVDMLRGATIALMILVNDPGDWGHVFPQLDHAQWNGWTLTDLVFPTFLFLVGASLVFSTTGRVARGDSRRMLAGHILARAGRIVLLDWILGFFPRMNWSHLRLFGVLTRIGLCYLAAGLLLLAVLRLRRRVLAIVAMVAALLLGYWLLLRVIPVPGLGLPGRDLPFMDPEHNLAAWLDRGFNGWTQHWLHTGSLYNHVRDPEGWLSTLPAVATTLLGALAGLALRAASRGQLAWGRLRVGLVVAGLGGVVVGSLWGVLFPINKNLWTSSYVLLAGGLAALALAACSWAVDQRPEPWPRALRWASWPWFVFGSNAIAAFVTSVVLVKAGLWFRVLQPDGHRLPVLSVIYRDVFARGGSTEWTSLGYALSFVAACFVPVWVLWRRRIFLKL